MISLRTTSKKALSVRNLILLPLALACLGILQMPASATNRYVATSGNDNNSGTLAQPWRTIQHGVNTISAGDTLYIRGGSYNERVDINSRNGSSGAWFTVKNYSGETPIMDADYSTGNDVAIKLYNCSYWHIEGLTVRDYIGAGFWVDGGSYIEIVRNLMYNFDPNDPSIGSGVEAILIGSSANNITIRGNTICEISQIYDRFKDHCIYVGDGASEILIDSNRMFDSAGAAVHMYGGAGTSYSVVCNNIMYANYRGVVMWDNGTGNYFLNNTFYGNTVDLDINQGASGAYFKNNIFGSLYASPNIWLQDTASNSNTFDYNCYWSNSGYPILRQGTWKTFAQWQGYGQEAHGRNGSPSFKDAAGGNFRVAGTSNCLGTGIDATVTYDFAGTVRETSSPDIGAYDYNYSFDQFNSVSKNTYTTYGGSWSQTGSPEYCYQQTTYSGLAKRAVFYDFPAVADGAPNNWASNKSWTNYIVEADVKMTGSGPYYDAGLVARASSNGNTYYVAILYTSQVDLWKVVNGSWTQLGTYTESHSTNTYYHLALACNGTSIAVSINGSGKISTTDSSISSGYPGMFTDYCGKFDNFKVAPY